MGEAIPKSLSTYRTTILLGNGHGTVIAGVTLRAGGGPLTVVDLNLVPGTLAYLSLRALVEAVADERHEYGYACYTSHYPTDLIDLNRLVSIKLK